MTVLKPRSRMISVRLSEEEYSALRDLCSLTGARSVSDLTRDAMRTVLRSVNREDPFLNNLEEFRVGIKNLEKKVEQLEAKITTIKTEGTQ
jgi:Arc/MetJ-type ribon-helix-helix transcriptional regulator